MGIIIGDTIVLSNGLSVSNTYGSFGDSPLTIEKSSTITLDDNNVEVVTYDGYKVFCKGSMWVDQACRINQKPKINGMNVEIKILESQLNNNLFALLYSEWNRSFTNVSDSTD